VQTARALGLARATGFVNGVLRKAVSMALPTDPFLDLPPWLRQRWAAWPDWVARLAEPARTAIVMRQPGAVPAFPVSAASAGGEPVPDAWWIEDAVTTLPGFAEGAFWVMDPAAARVAALAQGATVLDACAAPGGKAAFLASRGARVTTVDASGSRLARLRDNVARLRLAVDVRTHDWTTGPLPGAGTFDVVLVDAPCTSLGTARRHPEIRWRVLPSDPGAMAIVQESIVRAAATHVRPGGALVYAVCSPLAEEGLGVVNALDGWRIEARVASVPPAGDEDAHQGFLLRRA
jgi:16S rRNA (cytosine967-C5)-methyltransferase